MSDLRRCGCGRFHRMMSEDGLCGKCRDKVAKALRHKSDRRDRVPVKRGFQQMTLLEISAEIASQLRFYDLMGAHGPVTVYRPGDPGFDSIAMKYSSV